jgi:hypothetical protein
MTNLADIGPLTTGRPFKFQLFDRERPAVLVASHERSGTHFLMNSVGQAYGYCAVPWIDLDFTHFQMNFYDPAMLATALERLAERPIANIAKSHHAAAFFQPAMARLAPRWRILYIHRDPVDTLISYWRFVQQVPGHGGPRSGDVVDFVRAAPSGVMLRYQVRQWPSVLHRWASHLRGWMQLAKEWPQVVTLVRYDELRDRPAETLAALAGPLGSPPQSLAPLGPRQARTRGGAKDDAAEGRRPPDLEALRAHCRATLGNLLPALGYGP